MGKSNVFGYVDKGSSINIAFILFATLLPVKSLEFRIYGSQF